MMAAAGDGDQPVRWRASLRIHPSGSCSLVANAASAPPRPILRVLCKGRVITEEEQVVEGQLGGGGGGGGVPLLAVAVCTLQGEVLLRGHKLVPGFAGGHHEDDDGQVLLEAMALVEGLHTAIRLGITRVKAITDHRQLHNYMFGLSRSTGQKLADMIIQAQSVCMQFKQCDIILVKQGQVGDVVKLPKEGLAIEIAGYLAAKDKKESCKICFDDVDTAKIHTVERCLHRFCLSCMKKHIEVMLLHGMVPRCPQLGCSARLTVEDGSKVLLPSRLLEMMARRAKEEHIHPSQRIYCPYPKCSALMSLSEVLTGSSCSEYNNAETLRKCVKCGEPMCVKCKVAWHERMSCLEYQTLYPYGGGPQDEKLQKLARQQLWKRCERCSHMIEHATGCSYITCVCGNYLCYICGTTLTEDHGRCGCARRRRRGCFPLLACWRGIRH